jgi:hypothetical protein
MLRVAEDMRGKARELLERDGYVEPIATVFGARGPDGKPTPSVIFCSMGGDPGDPDVRDAFVTEVRKIATAADAFAVTYVMEMHLLEVARPKHMSHKEFLQHAHDNIVPSKDPSSVDCVFVQLEHEELFGTAMWVARCRRDAEGKLQAGEFEQWSDGTATGRGFKATVGRFTGLLPRRPGGVEA